MDAQSMMKKWFDGLNRGKLASGVVAAGFTYHGADTDFTMDRAVRRASARRDSGRASSSPSKASCRIFEART
jgi:hypothetical protein